MSMPSAARPKLVPRFSHRVSAAEWSFTASTGPNEQDNALVVYRVSTANLGIEDLTAQVAMRSGAAEARRWQRARTREYVVRLRDQLRLHLSNAELIVHADEADSDDRLQVIATVASGDANETMRLEEDIADRVQAITKRAWIHWSEGLRVTMAALDDLESEQAQPSA